MAQHKAKIHPLRAGDFTIRFLSAGRTYRICKLIFLNDGSLALAFPYFPDSPGIVAVSTLFANQSFPTNVDLSETGKVTSHLVKYSHHWSGEAVFSQDGKVLSHIRKQSVPLNRSSGHLFTIQVQEVSSFREEPDARPDPPWDPRVVVAKRTLTLQYATGNIDDGALKIVCRAFTKSLLREKIKGKAIGPAIHTIDPNGLRRNAWLLSANLNNPASSVVLVINGERIPKMTQDLGPHLTMIGGFDSPRVAFDHSQDTSFLALSYPAEDFDSLANTIGSIDLHSMQQFLGA